MIKMASEFGKDNYTDFMTKASKSQSMTIEEQIEAIKKAMAFSSCDWSVRGWLVYCLAFGEKSSDFKYNPYHKIIDRIKNDDKISPADRLHAIQEIVEEHDPEYWEQDGPNEIRDIALACNNLGYKSLKVEIKVEYEGKTIAIGNIHNEESFMADIMAAIRNNKNPVEALILLAEIGSKEMYSKELYEKWCKDKIGL